MSAWPDTVPHIDFVTVVGEAEIIKIEEVLSITTPPPPPSAYAHAHVCVCLCVCGVVCVHVCIHQLPSSLRHKMMMTTIVKHIHLKSRAGPIRDVFK